MFCWGLREVTAPCWSRRLEGLGFGIHQLRNRCSPHGRGPVPTPATWTCRRRPWCLLGAPSLPRKGWGASIATAADPTGRRLFGGRYPRAALRWPSAPWTKTCPWGPLGLFSFRPSGASGRSRTTEVNSRRRSSDCAAAARTRSEANSGRGRVLWLAGLAADERAEGTRCGQPEPARARTHEADSAGHRSSDCAAAARTRSEANSGRGRVLWLAGRAADERAEGPDAGSRSRRGPERTKRIRLPAGVRIAERTEGRVARRTPGGVGSFGWADAQRTGGPKDPMRAAGAGEGQNARSGFGCPPEFGLRSGRKDA